MNRILPILLCCLLGQAGGVAKANNSWERQDRCRLLSHRYGDGDSFYVQLKDGRERVFRLYFVDAPETDDSLVERIQDQADYWNIRQTDVLKLGHEASKLTSRVLKGKTFTVYTRWEDARGRGTHKRFFAWVVVDERYLSEILVEAGLARIYGKPADRPDRISSKSLRRRYQKLEKEARRKKRGAWGLGTRDH